MYETYKHYYLEIIQNAIDMLFPTFIRGMKEFKDDIEVFSSTAVRNNRYFAIDKAEFLKLLYDGLLEKKTFPWSNRTNSMRF